MSVNVHHLGEPPTVSYVNWSNSEHYILKRAWKRHKSLKHSVVECIFETII
jgi:hypothetical protein